MRYPLVAILLGMLGTACTTSSPLAPPVVEEPRDVSDRQDATDTGTSDDPQDPDTHGWDVPSDVQPDTATTDTALPDTTTTDGSCVNDPLCSVEGNYCDDFDLIRCARDADGCLTSIRVPCDAGETCHPALSECVATQVCGNALLESGEQCDDGNATAGDGCDACAVEAGWSCGGSPSVCTEVIVCGDGRLDPSEFCDDGNTRDGDGCTATCQVESGWSCSGSPSVCTRPSVCGDRDVTGAEECDDGNTRDGDGCSSECLEEVRVTCDHISAGLTCSSGTIARESFDDWNHYMEYGACDGRDRYFGSEGIFVFRTASAQRVTLNLEIHDTAPVNWDLLVMQLSAPYNCESGLTCAASAVSDASGESLSFDAVAGATYLIVADGESGFSVDYTLGVSCTAC